jgi:hypothetical protein
MADQDDAFERIVERYCEVDRVRTGLVIEMQELSPLLISTR